MNSSLIYSFRINYSVVFNNFISYFNVNSISKLANENFFIKPLRTRRSSIKHTHYNVILVTINKDKFYVAKLLTLRLNFLPIAVCRARHRNLEQTCEKLLQTDVRKRMNNPKKKNFYAKLLFVVLFFFCF